MVTRIDTCGIESMYDQYLKGAIENGGLQFG